MLLSASVYAVTQHVQWRESALQTLGIDYLAMLGEYLTDFSSEVFILDNIHCNVSNSCLY